MPETPRPEAVLVVAQQCPHCTAVMSILSDMIKHAKLRELRVYNIQHIPDELRHIRAVPWIRIGPFELQGQHTAAELVSWADRASNPDAIGDYLNDLLANGQLEQAGSFLSRQPEHLPLLIKLTADENTPMATRIGIGALFEGLYDSKELFALASDLIRLSDHRDARVRADCAHFMGLTYNPAVIPVLEKMISDSNEEVREIARESLELVKK